MSYAVENQGNSTVACSDKTLPRIQKHVPETKTLPRNQNTSQNPKHFPESKNTSQNFGFWDVT